MSEQPGEDSSVSPAAATATAGVDVGGTFTDVVVLTARPRAVKVPTTPSDQVDGVLDGLRLGAGASDRVAVMAHGTTTATNAVLEREIARTVLVTTDGFADVLSIARQDRPSLYDLSVTSTAHLAAGTVTAHERTLPDGEPLVPLTHEEVERVVDAVAALEPDSVAVSLLFGFAADDHERRLSDALAGRLGVPVTRGSALLPEFREYERASTCVLNAAIAPVMQGYLAELDRRLPQTGITVMTSGGGTAGLDFAAAAPVHTLLSGPAAGVVAAGAVAASAGFDDAIAFDMGGTSTDVCLIRSGRPEIATDAAIDGMPFRTPAVAIHTVGAGGGSLAWVDPGGALRVGPRSAGAVPGPACYGRGGTEPAVTDAHAVLGHLDPDRELGGGLRLDVAAARRAITRLSDAADGAAGVLTVVRATMARALRRVSTERGVDPADLALVAYGGAGPLHATALARELGCAAVVIPPAPGVLSALGLLLAPLRYEAMRTVMSSPSDDIADVWTALEREAIAELRRQRPGAEPTSTRVADCRYAGQSHELRIDIPSDGDVAGAFHRAHRTAYGYAMTNEPVHIVTARVVAEADPALEALPSAWDQGKAGPDRRRRIHIGGEAVTARVCDRAGMTPHDAIEGPALIEQSDTTTLLGVGERALVDAVGNLVVTWDE